MPLNRPRAERREPASVSGLAPRSGGSQWPCSAAEPCSASRKCGRIAALDDRRARYGDQHLSFDRFRRVPRLPGPAPWGSDTSQRRCESEEDFKYLGGDTLDKLDVYIAHCDAVVHLVGDMCGAAADEKQQQALVAKYSDLQGKLPPLGEILTRRVRIPYTHWEAWLALYHGKQLYVAKPEAAAPRGPSFAPTKASRAAQAAHLKRLEAAGRYPLEFTNSENLAKQIVASGILDLLAKDYADRDKIEIHTSEETIARVVNELVRQGVVQQAADAGIETSVIASLAARLKPTQKLDFAQAVIEVSHAVDIAMNVVAEDRAARAIKWSMRC
jgi:hypothetical protein